MFGSISIVLPAVPLFAHAAVSELGICADLPPAVSIDNVQIIEPI